MLPPRHGSDSQLWYAGRNSGSPLAGTWNSHERSCSNARVLQWDAEQPRNSPESRGAVLARPQGAPSPEATIR